MAVCWCIDVANVGFLIGTIGHVDHGKVRIIQHSRHFLEKKWTCGSHDNSD